ncbi:EamA family transporter [Nocardia sp. CDC153]|uniref:EamA family transporter n=1 Tax=Nocardia sp. CDC153 TaxID=3112167 RepID=UPI002DB56622|nr:EamA family transporter [Nocardia sp. CDC153]MEC3955790.1 EamA family transporter [Nocardia sp. CDC153]
MTTSRAGAAGLAGTLALTGLAPLVWGSTYAVTTTFLPPERPMFTAVMRVLPAGLLLLALTRKLPYGQWISRALVLGVLNIGIFTALLFVAAYRLPGGVAAVLTSAAPLFAVGFAALAGIERLTGRKIVAGLIGMAGVALVVLKATAALDTLGVLAGIVAAVAMGSGTVLTKRWGRPEGVTPLAMTGWQLTAGGLMLLPIAALVEGAPPALDARNIGGYLYLGLIGTAVAYALWFRGIARASATSVQFLGLLSPLSATVIGWAALGQSLTVLQILGMAIVLGGTLLGQTSGAPRAVESTPAAENAKTRLAA